MALNNGGKEVHFLSSTLYLCVIFWKVWESFNQRCSKHIRQIFAMNRSHALWIIAVFRLIVKHIEEAFWADFLLTRLNCRRSQHITRMNERCHELGIRQRRNGCVTCIYWMLRGSFPVWKLISEKAIVLKFIQSHTRAHTIRQFQLLRGTHLCTR